MASVAGFGAWINSQAVKTVFAGLHNGWDLLFDLRQQSKFLGEHFVHCRCELGFQLGHDEGAFIWSIVNKHSTANLRFAYKAKAVPDLPQI